MGPVLEYVRKMAGVEDGPVTPEGVYARVIDGRTFYVNSNWGEVSVIVKGAKRGLLSGKRFEGTVTIPAKGAELIESEK